MKFDLTVTFGSIATIITGLIALLLYYLSKRSYKSNAARIILAEIRVAESSVAKIKETKVINDYTSIMSRSSWNDYKHLFVRDIDSDELKNIDVFYLHCSLAEKQIGIYVNFDTIGSNERAKIIQHKLLELADTYKDGGQPNSNIQYQEHKNKILEIFHHEPYWYEAYAPKNKVIEYISAIQLVLNTTAGEKLRKISNRII